jgi:D-xylose transport system substrate-binding protein
MSGLVRAAVAASACGSDDTSGGGGSTSTSKTNAKGGVILPDTASSKRWENNDRPFLAAAFKAAGADSDIQSAQRDKAKFATLADQMLSGGANAERQRPATHLTVCMLSFCRRRHAAGGRERR